MKNSRGFTLIDLLVVIAIIALLLAIVIPALGQTKKKAQAVICLSNLKQIGLAANLYAQSWDSYVPRGISVAAMGLFGFWHLCLILVVSTIPATIVPLKYIAV